MKLNKGPVAAVAIGYYPWLKLEAGERVQQRAGICG